jgi:hypothetical protein
MQEISDLKFERKTKDETQSTAETQSLHRQSNPRRECGASGAIGGVKMGLFGLRIG